MPKPLVSIVIPTYNRLDYVQQAVESVLAQTYQNFELLVIDDGSTDATCEVLPAKYKGRINYIWQENRGESAARNRGLALSKGQYIAFLDSDDLWCPQKLSSQVKMLENPARQDIVAVYSSVWIIDSQGSRIQRKPAGQKKRARDWELIDFLEGPKIFAPPSNLMIRSEYVQQLEGFDIKIQYGEDWDFIIRLRSLGKLLYIDQPLLQWRRHIANQQRIPQHEKLEKVLADRLRIIQKNAHLFHGEERKILAAEALAYERAAYWYFALGDIDRGVAYLKRASELDPSLITSRGMVPKLGYWTAVGILPKDGTLEDIKELFERGFLPEIIAKWPAEFPTLNLRHLRGWVYHNLAFLLDNNDVKRYLLQKSIKSKPQFFFSWRTILALLLSLKRGDTS
jgi:glycosyltransferase involved in cell wall biosynthesis